VENGCYVWAVCDSNNGLVAQLITQCVEFHSNLCLSLLVICHPSDRTVASGVVVVVVGVCKRSQMRTSKCTCLIFVMTLARNAQKEFLIEVIMWKKMNIL